MTVIGRMPWLHERKGALKHASPGTRFQWDHARVKSILAAEIGSAVPGKGWCQIGRCSEGMSWRAGNAPHPERNTAKVALWMLFKICACHFMQIAPH